MERNWKILIQSITIPLLGGALLLSGCLNTDLDFVRLRNPNFNGPIGINIPIENATTGTTVNLDGVCLDGFTVTISGTEVSGATFTCDGGTFSGVNITLLGAEGIKIVEIKQTDGVDFNSKQRQYTLDTTPPATSITSPATNTYTTGAINISGVCESGLDVNISGTDVSPSTFTCTGGSYASVPITFTGLDGTKTVQISQTDIAGNLTNFTRNFGLDTTGPNAVSTFDDGTNTLDTNSPSISWTGGTTDIGIGHSHFEIAIGTTPGATDVKPYITAVSPVSYTGLASYPPGTTLYVSIRTFDGFGNYTETNGDGYLITAGPTLTIDSPPDGTSGATGIQLQGTCETGLDISFSGDIQPKADHTCAGNAFDLFIAFSAESGQKTVTLTSSNGSPTVVNGSYELSVAPPETSLCSTIEKTATYPNLELDPSSAAKVICTADQLDDLSEDPTGWGGNYILKDHIDLQGVTFTPIGSAATSFTGRFDGNGFSVKKLTLNTPGSSYVGLFGRISLGVVVNLSVIDADITGFNYVGALAGYSLKGAIQRNFSSGTVTGTGTSGGTGGLLGYSTGETLDSASTATVTGSNQGVGGLIGYQSGKVYRSYATGSVVGSGAANVGGLIGYLTFASGRVEDCFSTGNVSGPTVGGLIGFRSNGTILNSFWDPSTSGQSNMCSTMSGSCTNGTAVSSAGYYFDATQEPMVQWDFINIWREEINLYPSLKTVSNFSLRTATCSQSERNATYPGLDVDSGAKVICTNTQFLGLVGDSGGWSNDYVLKDNIKLSSNLSQPIGNSSTPYAGIFDGNGYQIQNIAITSPGTETGLFGVANGEIKNLIINGIQLTGGSKTGAIVGRLTGSGKITRSAARGTVKTISAGGASDGVGGLVGSMDSGSASISDSFADVRSSGNGTNVGGLIGYMSGGSILRSYASGDAEGLGGSTYVAGLIGRMDGGNLSDSFAKNRLSQISGSSNSAGIIGYAAAGVSLTDTYWDKDESGQSSMCKVDLGFQCADGNGITGNSIYFFNIANLPLSNWNFGVNQWSALPGSAPIHDHPKPATSGASGPCTSDEQTAAYPNLVGDPITGFATLCTREQIKQIGDLKGSIPISGRSFILKDNIDMDRGGQGNVSSLSDITNIFTGTFDGNGFTLSNLGLSLGSLQGFIGYLGGGEVRDLTITNGYLTSTGATTGFIAGYGYAQYNAWAIRNVHVTGTVDTPTRSNVGGIIGSAAGVYSRTIEDSSFTGTVSGADSVGGIVGQCTGCIIRRSWVNANVSASLDNSKVGTMVGVLKSSGQIYDSYVDLGSTVTSTGMAVKIGGLVGSLENGFIYSSYSAGNINHSAGGAYAGGLVGDITSGSIFDSFATGTLTLTGATFQGGLIGRSFGNHSNNWFSSIGTGEGAPCGSDSNGQCSTGISDGGSINTFYTSTNAPLSTWNFGGVWTDGLGVAYPTQ